MPARQIAVASLAGRTNGMPEEELMEYVKSVFKLSPCFLPCICKLTGGGDMRKFNPARLQNCVFTSAAMKENPEHPLSLLKVSLSLTLFYFYVVLAHVCFN